MYDENGDTLGTKIVESPEGLARAMVNRDYAKVVKTHKEEQAKIKKEGKAEMLHSFGSPFLHQYQSLLENAKVYFEKEKKSAVDGSSKLKGTTMEIEADVFQTVEEDQVVTQILEFLEKLQSGVVSATPAPPGRKGREFRKRLSKQRAAGTRLRM